MNFRSFFANMFATKLPENKIIQMSANRDEYDFEEDMRETELTQAWLTDYMARRNTEVREP